MRNITVRRTELACSGTKTLFRKAPRRPGGHGLFIVHYNKKERGRETRSNSLAGRIDFGFHELGLCDLLSGEIDRGSNSGTGSRVPGPGSKESALCRVPGAGLIQTKTQTGSKGNCSGECLGGRTAMVRENLFSRE